MTTETTLTIRLPKTFWEDHTNRDLPGGKLIKSLATKVDIEATRDELVELASDADYYYESFRDEGSGFCTIGLARSAKATLDAINRLLAK